MRAGLAAGRALLPILVFIPIGLGIGTWSGVRGLEHSTSYRLLVATLLAIGLYASTRTIDLAKVRPDARLILRVVTMGVLVKAALIGGTLALAFRDPLFLLLGVAMAQVDPLSVARVSRDQRLSTRAQRILSAWASFDDPVTAVLTLSVAVVLGPHLAQAPMPLMGGDGPAVGLLGFLGDVALAGLVYGLWLLTHRSAHPRVWQYPLLVAALVVAVTQFHLLAIAIIGLFLRPPLAGLTRWALAAAGAAAAVLLGVLLAAAVTGPALARGIALGVAAYAAHAVVAVAMTRSLPKPDRVHLTLAQQSGVTAIVLSLLLETDFPGVVAVVGPAIVTTNLIYQVTNWVVGRHLRMPGPTSLPAPARADDPGPAEATPTDSGQTVESGSGRRTPGAVAKREGDPA